MINGSVDRSRTARVGPQRRGRPSAALLVASLALLVALGGTSYAALNLPAGSVGSRQLRRGAVTAIKLATRAVTTRALATGSVTTSKLAPGAVRSGDLAASAVTTAKLAPGAVTNDDIQPGAGLKIVYVSGIAVVAPSTKANFFTSCPPRMNAIAGGLVPIDFSLVELFSSPYNSRSQFSGAADSWYFGTSNTDPAHAQQASTYVVCVKAGSAHSTY